jgi:hypothetical protein
VAGLSDAAMVVGANAIKAAITHGQLHSAAAGPTGVLSVTSAARQAITWSSVTANGDFSLASPLNFTGGANNGAVYSITVWSASTAGTFYGEFVLTGDQAFNSSGQYSVTALTIDGSAS